jgi:hypothetical protein
MSFVLFLVQFEIIQCVQGSFYLYFLVHCAALHGSHCTASCQAYMNFATESESLMADNVWDEVVMLNR